MLKTTDNTNNIINIKKNRKNNPGKKNLSSSNLFIKDKLNTPTELDTNPHINKGNKNNSHLNSNKTFNSNLSKRLYRNNQSFRNMKMSSNNSRPNLISSSPKNISIKSNSNSGRRNMINTSKILLKKNKSSINIKSKGNKSTQKTSSNKIKILSKDKDSNKSHNTQRKSPTQNINKFNLFSKKINPKKKSPEKAKENIGQISKEKIQERIAKTSLNSYRNSSHEEDESIKPKKKSSLIYNRKRNINDRYNKIFNNLSNNSSKDSSKIYYSISNRSLQSIDKNKNGKIKQAFINGAVVGCKVNQNKKNMIYNKCNKKFIAIQNFSRYKKKSVLFYKNNETNVNSNYYIHS